VEEEASRPMNRLEYHRSQVERLNAILKSKDRPARKADPDHYTRLMAERASHMRRIRILLGNNSEFSVSKP
jgi:hypothetical protein